MNAPRTVPLGGTVEIGGRYFVVEQGDPVATGPTVRIRALAGKPIKQREPA